MSGGAARSSSSKAAVPGPRRQSLKGCMGAFPHMFQWNRILGSDNRCIAATADVVQTLPGATSNQLKQTQSKRWAYVSKQTQAVQHIIRGVEDQLGAGQVLALAKDMSVSGNSSFSESVSDRNATSRETHQTTCVDLRQVLHAKQEPFVLQDVIRQKKQPMRTDSSRELKYSGAPAARGSTRRLKSQEYAATDPNAACSADQCGRQRCVPTAGSAAVVSRKVPVESMVALPAAYQAAPAVCGVTSSAKQAHGKPASTQSRNPVKSPNKRALLMEAAARILEGSNRRTNHSKRPSNSARSLLEELEKSKKAKDQSKDKENQVVSAPVVLHSEASDDRQGVSPANDILLVSSETPTESMQGNQMSYDSTVFGKNDSSSFININHFENTPFQQVLDEVDLLVLHNRVSPCNSSAGKEVEVSSSQLATSVTYNQNAGSIITEHIQFSDDVSICYEKMQVGTQNEPVDMGCFKFDASESSLLQAERSSSTDLLNQDALAEDSRAIVVPSSSKGPTVDFSAFMLDHTCLRPVISGNRTPSLIRVVLDDFVASHLTWGYDLRRGAPFSGNHPQENNLLSARSTLIESGTAAETGYRYANQTRERTHMESERKSSVMKLRLCNYSWWAHDSPQISHSGDNLAQLKSVELYSCDGYNSPLPASRRPSFCKKVWDAEIRDEECSGEEVSECLQGELEQASPVSVLEPVQYEDDEEEEEGPVDGHSDSFDNFEEARQKLLEKVRRYEMLARMDVAMLRKVSDEQASDACTREVYYHEDNEWWETDSRSSSSSSSSSSFQGAAASVAPDCSSSDDDESEDCRNSLSVADHQCSWIVEYTETRPLSTSLNCLTTKLEPIRPSNCSRDVDLQVGEALLRRCSDQRFNVIMSGEDHRSNTEAEKRRPAAAASCSSSSSTSRRDSGDEVANVVINGLLHTDLTKSSSYTNWSRSRYMELQEEVEVELESCFFDILLCELLCELLELAPEQNLIVMMATAAAHLSC